MDVSTACPIALGRACSWSNSVVSLVCLCLCLCVLCAVCVDRQGSAMEAAGITWGVGAETGMPG